MKQTILITGTSTGLGRTTARFFAARGWNVVATMRRPETEAELTHLENVLVTRLDVQNLASIGAAIAEGIKRFGRIDALLNNAGFGLFGLFEGTPREKIQEQFDVNVFDVMDTTRAILPHFRQNRAGIILNVSSGAGVFTLPMISLYCASKFALEGFSEALSYEVGSQGITVKIIEPGGILSTGFNKRSGAEAGHVNALPDYDAFARHSGEVFAGLVAKALATEEDVAKVIFEAATDGADRLRYVATEDIVPLVRARRETSEESYHALMRSRFTVGGSYPTEQAD
jgi:NAD(P)-dependent dehydrogenase (short-subunit alcohol dehydrogenase family)